jgi:hypothetical protein
MTVVRPTNNYTAKSSAPVPADPDYSESLPGRLKPARECWSNQQFLYSSRGSVSAAFRPRMRTIESGDITQAKRPRDAAFVVSEAMWVFEPSFPVSGPRFPIDELAFGARDLSP